MTITATQLSFHDNEIRRDVCCQEHESRIKVVSAFEEKTRKPPNVAHFETLKGMVLCTAQLFLHGIMPHPF